MKPKTHPAIRAALLSLVVGAAGLACTKGPTETKSNPTPRGLALPGDPPSDPKAPVARIDNETITEGELTSDMEGAIIRSRNEYLEKLHQLRAQGLEQMIDKRLLERKAKAENLTVEKLLERDVFGKIADPSEDEVKMVYDMAQQRGQPLPPLEMVRADIVGFLKQKKAEEAVGAYRAQLREGVKIENLLPPLLLPKVNVEAIGVSKGEQNAPVTIVEFSDFECGFCARVEPTVKQLLEEYKGKVRLVYRDFPLDGHPSAPKASEAALCAGDQGKYWEMHDKLFASQDSLDVPSLKAHAKELSLDQAKFDACLDGGEKGKVVDEHKKAGEKAGVGATPAFFINGRPLSGALPIEEFKKIIDMELANKG